MFYSANGKFTQKTSNNRIIEGMTDQHSHPTQLHSHPDTQNLDDIRNKQDELQKQINDFKVPAGTIVMWSGSNQPNGWAICDGENGTPDLRGKFIVGLNTEDSDHNSIGKTGGKATFKLTENQLPEHKHMIERAPIDDRNFTDGGGNENQILGLVGDSGSSNDHKGSGGNNSSSNPNNRGRWSSIVGGSKPIENRPPFYTLAYIMKL